MHVEAHTRATRAKLSRPTQEDYMEVAIWMARYLNRHTYGRYGKILNHLLNSQTRAGGPALRLMQAAWHLEDRRRHPRDKVLVVKEENSFAHLYHNHRDPTHKKYYYVWRAMELFVNYRLDAVGMALLPTVREADIATPNPLRQELRLLDTYLEASPPRIYGNPVISLASRAIAEANPTAKELLLSVIRATHAYALWLSDTTSGEAFETFQQAANTALNQQYKNRAYLTSREPQLDAAITDLRRALAGLPA